MTPARTPKASPLLSTPIARGSARGEPLPASARAELEPLFGVNFSAVRVHADRAAGASALALGARAYSAGRDIVFAPGHFAPHTAVGRELLAHELAHVAQDGVQELPPAQPMVLDAPDSPQEREAEQIARTAAAPAHVIEPMLPLANRQARSRHRAPVLHRSLLGAGIGGVLGGVGLGLLGGLLGPVGAIAGAIVGTVAGAALGDIASRRSRKLTSAEKAYLREIFHDAVDYDKITITRGAALSAGSATTLGNTINLKASDDPRYSDFRGDTLELSASGLLTLAHETGHVWQYQTGGLAYIPSSLIPQLVASMSGQSRNAAYDWRSAVRNRIDWSEWNAEQQAECISDFNEAKRRIDAGTETLRDYQTVTLAQPFIELVRARIGAPGSSRRRREPSPAPAGAPP